MSDRCPIFQPERDQDEAARTAHRPGVYAVSVDVTVVASSIEEAERIVAAALPEATPLMGPLGPVMVAQVRDDHTAVMAVEEEL